MNMLSDFDRQVKYARDCWRHRDGREYTGAEIAAVMDVPLGEVARALGHVETYERACRGQDAEREPAEVGW